MCSQAKITIVIPARNREKLVLRTLESVKAQTLRPLRLVLVDNGSSDSTWTVLQQWAEANNAPDFQVTVIQEPQPGAAAARNAGLKLVETEWTMFFDSDDVMLPTHAQLALDCAAANPSASVIGWDMEIRPLSGRPSVKPFSLRRPLANCVLHGSMATERYMARTSLFRQAGGWRPDVMAWNDIELGVRLLVLNPKMAKVKGKPTVIVHSTLDSITGTSYSRRHAALEHSLDCIEASAPGAGAIVATKRAVLAGLYRREGHPKLTRNLYKKMRAKNMRAFNYQLCLLATAATALGIPGASVIHRFFIKS